MSDYKWIHEPYIVIFLLFLPTNLILYDCTLFESNKGVKTKYETYECAAEKPGLAEHLCYICGQAVIVFINPSFTQFKSYKVLS